MREINLNILIFKQSVQSNLLLEVQHDRPSVWVPFCPDEHH